MAERSVTMTSITTLTSTTHWIMLLTSVDWSTSINFRLSLPSRGPIVLYKNTNRFRSKISKFYSELGTDLFYGPQIFRISGRPLISLANIFSFSTYHPFSFLSGSTFVAIKPLSAKGVGMFSVYVLFFRFSFLSFASTRSAWTR